MEQFIAQHPAVMMLLFGVVLAVVGFLIKNKINAIDTKASKTCKEVNEIKNNYNDKFDSVEDKVLGLHLKIDKHHLANQTMLQRLLGMQQEQQRLCKFIQDGKRNN